MVRERVFLNQVKQPLFGLEVVVQPRQGHAAFARQIAHGSAFISLFAENFGGVAQNFGKPPIVARFRERARCDAGANQPELSRME